MPRASVSAKQAVMQPNKLLTGVAFGLWMLSPIAIVLAVTTGIYPLLTMLVHSILFGTMAYSYGTRALHRLKPEEGALAIDDKNVLLDGKVVIPRTEIKQAFIVPYLGESYVRLDRRGFGAPLVLRAKNEADAKGILEKLGLDAAHAAAELKVASQLFAMSVLKQLGLIFSGLLVFVPAMLLSITTFPHNATPFVFGLLALLLAWIFGLSFAPTTVRVGTDGISTQWLRQKRFYSFTRIKRVETYREHVTNKIYYGVKVTLGGGEVVKIPTGQTDIAEQEARRLLERIEEARAEGGGSAATVTEALGRGEREHVDWVRALRRLGEGAFGPRTAAVPRDQIFRILEDGTAAPLDRASAAVAALSSVDQRDRADAKARVRVAAETAASPELRVALDRIAEANDDDDIGSALAELGRRR